MPVPLRPPPPIPHACPSLGSVDTPLEQPMRVSRFTEEFKSDALDLVRRGNRSLRQVASDLGISYWTLREWYRQSEMAKRKKAKAAAPSGSETAEQELQRLRRENALLRRENEQLRQDREILKKAAAFFAKESE